MSKTPVPAKRGHPAEKAVSQRQRLYGVFRDGIRHLFLHNGLVKLAAVLISVVLWAGLISQDESLTRDKSFSDVNVNITGIDTMKRNGYIVTSDLSEVLGSVNVVVAVPQQQYENAEAGMYNLRVDLSRVNGTGEQELRLLSTNSSTYGRVVSISPATVTVQVEEYVVRQRIPVSVSVSGEIPSEWYMSTPAVDPSLVTVAGPRSAVQSISRAKAYINPEDLEWNEGTLWTSVEFQLYDRSGEKVDRSQLEVTVDSMTIDSVLIESTVLPKKTFDTVTPIEISGTPEEGYEVREIRVSPESVTVAARQEVLNQLEELPMERTVNISGLKETRYFQLKIKKPSDDAILSNDTVTVTVEIGPVEPADSHEE